MEEKGKGHNIGGNAHPSFWLRSRQPEGEYWLLVRRKGEALVVCTLTSSIEKGEDYYAWDSGEVDVVLGGDIS